LRSFAVWAAVTALLLVMTVPVNAAPVSYDLTMTFRSPVWSSRDGYISNYKASEFGGMLKLNNVISGLKNFHPYVSGLQALGDINKVFDAKSELQAGFDYTLGRGLTFASWWDRHFKQDVDRAFVAVRYNCHGLF
jgi:hypothetical protein